MRVIGKYKYKRMFFFVDYRCVYFLGVCFVFRVVLNINVVLFFSMGLSLLFFCFWGSCVEGRCVGRVLVFGFGNYDFGFWGF